MFQTISITDFLTTDELSEYSTFIDKSDLLDKVDHVNATDLSTHSSTVCGLIFASTTDEKTSVSTTNESPFLSMTD